jgi:hypothetical protein
MRTKLITTALFSLVSAALPPISARADSLDDRRDVYYSRNGELALYRFGFDSERPKPCHPAARSRHLPRSWHELIGSSPRARQAAARTWSELGGYHLDDAPRAIIRLGRHARLPDAPEPEKITRNVQRLSDRLVGAVAGLLRDFFGGDDAFADVSEPTDAEVLAEAAAARDGLVHF